MKGIVASLFWLANLAKAQSSSSKSPAVITLTGSARSLTRGDFGPVPTVPSSFQGSTFATITLSSSSGITGTSNNTTPSSTTTEEPLTNIGGSNRTSTPTSTGTAARPSNTQPCNNYVEFCNRKYSNITEVCAHNSPFIRQNNVARNQDYGVTQQLNDGIRMLQGQAHYLNGTLHYCHTSCDLLNAGTVEDYLREVTKWLEAHPFEVITIIFGNYDWQDKDSDGNAIVTSADFVDPIEKSGLRQYIYQPSKTAMTLEDWPTLGEMIINNKRVVTFIDYNFDTSTVPYMLWEFYNIWETPFSPTDPTFPCTLGRPEGLGEDQMRNMMYMVNHNLNAEIAFGGFSLLIPNVAVLNQTNAVEGNGSLGLTTEQCTGMWDRPPNFLLVDFYNQGPTNGSVFEVAARANGVTYNRKCCGKAESLAAMLLRPSATYFGFVVAIGVALIL
ncbi:Nn.00g064020.m01.CDS01 [Neocucurbitaria sp. VM-36]